MSKIKVFAQIFGDSHRVCYGVRKVQSRKEAPKGKGSLYVSFFCKFEDDFGSSRQGCLKRFNNREATKMFESQWGHVSYSLFSTLLCWSANRRESYSKKSQIFS